MLNIMDIDIILITLAIVLVFTVVTRLVIQYWKKRRKALSDAATVKSVLSEPEKNNQQEYSEETGADRDCENADLLEKQPSAAKENSNCQPEGEISQNGSSQKDQLERKDEEKDNCQFEEPIPQKDQLEKKDEESVTEETEKSDNNAAFEQSDSANDKKPSADVDYQRLSSDPIGILSDIYLPTNYRVLAIREIAYQDLKDAVPQLIAALYDEDATISMVAAECLGSMGDPRAIEPLLEISQRNSAEISKTIEEYIGGELTLFENTEFIAKPEEKSEPFDSVPYNFKELVVFTPEQMSKDYFQADGTLISRKELVLKGLNDSNELMRQVAAKAAIGLEESEDVIEPLSKTLENLSESEIVRAMAAEALGGMESAKSVSALVNALKDDNVAVRYAASVALGGCSDSSAIDGLINATLDKDKYVRASSACALGKTAPLTALPSLIKCAFDETDIVRFAAVKSLASYEFDDVLDKISDNQEDGKESILGKIDILSQFKDERAVAMLKRYLENSDSEISYRASMALMGYENPDLLDELISASKRFDEELYELAKENLAPEIFSEITKYNDAGKVVKKS